MSNPSNQPNPSEDGASSPIHVAVIMDGNGRWARKRGLPRVAGHQKGVQSVRSIIEYSAKAGIQNLTVFAFSSENWKRPEKEVRRLMELFVQSLDKYVAELHENNIRFRVIGDTQSLSVSVQQRIEKSEQLTKNNVHMVLNVAINYGGRWDIANACRQVAEKAANSELEVSEVDEDCIASFLTTAGIPDPDLFIRTGGEKRISNFLLWQLAYTELYFTDVLWPDFGVEQYREALDWFASRQRRFGQTGEQVEAAS